MDCDLDQSENLNTPCWKHVLKRTIIANCKLGFHNGWVDTISGEKSLVPLRGLIPLMVIVQHKKGKVRPVMDYRETKRPYGSIHSTC